MKHSYTYVIGASIALFCAFSLFLFFHIAPREPHCDIDSKAYLERGLLFSQTNRFITPTSSQQPYYALGYSLCIGILYKLFGQSTGVIILFQLLLALISLLLIMRVTRRFFGKRAAAIAAILFACNVGYLTFTQFVLTEIVLSFLLLLFFERMTAHVLRDGPLDLLRMSGEKESFCSSGQLKMIINEGDIPAHPEERGFQAERLEGHERFWVLIQAALALGASIIIKPAAIFFVFPLCLLLLVALPASGKRRLATAAIFVLFFYLPVVSYMTYNYYAFGNFCVSTLDRVNVYYWYFPNVLATHNHTTSDAERCVLQALPASDVAQRFADMLKQHPFLFARVWLLNVAKTWLGLYTTNLKVLVELTVHGGDISFFKTTGSVWCKAWGYIAAGATRWWVVAIGVFEALWSIIRLLLLFLGFLSLLRHRKLFFAMLSLLFLAYFSLITGHDGCARFRMMFEFLLIVLAAGGFDSFLHERAFDENNEFYCLEREE